MEGEVENSTGKYTNIMHTFLEKEFEYETLKDSIQLFINLFLSLLLQFYFFFFIFQLRLILDFHFHPHFHFHSIKRPQIAAYTQIGDPTYPN